MLILAGQNQNSDVIRIDSESIQILISTMTYIYRIIYHIPGVSSLYIIYPPSLLHLPPSLHLNSTVLRTYVMIVLRTYAILYVRNIMV